MAKSKAGGKRVKTGGRTKGTPNKISKVTKDVISSLLDDYNESGKMQEDFDALDPKDRLVVAEKLMQYVMPKLQSASVDMSVEKEKTIEDQLRELSEEATNN